MCEVAGAGMVLLDCVCFFDVETLLSLMRVQGLLSRSQCGVTDSLLLISVPCRFHGVLDRAFLLKCLKSRTSSFVCLLRLCSCQNVGHSLNPNDSGMSFSVRAVPSSRCVCVP